MKKIIFSLAMLLATPAMAECDFSTGISKLPNGNYEYTKECHIKVGETVQDLDIAKKQNEKYLKALDLKDLAISKADQRTQLWMDTSFKLEQNIQTMESWRGANQWFYFGLGAATVFASGYMASQLIHR